MNADARPVLHITQPRGWINDPNGFGLGVPGRAGLDRHCSRTGMPQVNGVRLLMIAGVLHLRFAGPVRSRGNETIDRGNRTKTAARSRD